MLLVRLALTRGGCLSAVPLYCQHGSILSRCIPGLTLVKPRFRTTQKSTEEEIDLDAPIKFSTSHAAKWKSRHTYSGKEEEVDKRPWYEPYVVILSTAVFLVYFCILREESNVDTKFAKSLYDHISGLEEKQLELALQYNTETGRDTLAIKNRLEELRKERAMEETASENTGKS